MKRLLVLLLVLVSATSFAQKTQLQIYQGINSEIRLKSAYNNLRMAALLDTLNKSYVNVTGSYANPSWLTSLAGSKITGYHFINRNDTTHIISGFQIPYEDDPTVHGPNIILKDSTNSQFRVYSESGDDGSFVSMGVTNYYGDDGFFGVITTRKFTAQGNTAGGVDQARVSVLPGSAVLQHVNTGGSVQLGFSNLGVLFSDTRTTKKGIEYEAGNWVSANWTDNTLPTWGAVKAAKTYTGAQTFRAGTATAGTAPVYFQSGTALTTPANGAMEYHSSHLYFTIGSTRYQLDQQGGGSVTSVSGTTNRITSTGGSTPVIDISATFEALLGKVANRIDQNNASTTSAQLATTLSDESGTGTVVYSSTLSSYQPLDSDLTAIAGLSATNDDFIQRKSGAWTNRTVAQVKTDLGLTGTNSGDQTTSGTTNRITVSSGSTNPVIDISATFEALLGKVASPLSQFASTTSSQLAGVISDETGTGVLVYGTSPTFTTQISTPVVNSSAGLNLIATSGVTAQYLGVTNNLTQFAPKVTDATTTRTLTEADRGRMIVFTNAGAISVTLPNSLSNDFYCYLRKSSGAGDITITATTTLNVIGGSAVITEDWAIAMVWHEGSNVWGASGTFGAGGGGTPAGLDTYVQYNNSGAFGASSNFTYVDGTSTLTVNNVVGLVSLTSNGGVYSVGGVLFANGTTSNAGGLSLGEDLDNGTDYITFLAAASMASPTQYVFPAAFPAGNGYSLTSTTSGVLSWTNVSGGGGSYWDLASGGTLSSANTITLTTTNNVAFSTASLGTTVGESFLLSTPTAAAVGAQQIGTPLLLRSNGWKTTATAASQPVEWAIYNLPIQGTTNPSTELTFAASINNGSYNIRHRFSETGKVTFQNGSATIDFDPTANGNIGTNGIMTFTTNGVPKITLSSAGDWAMFQSAGTSGARTGFSFQSAAHTGQTASTNIPIVLWDFATNNRQFATGAKTTQQDFQILGNTHRAVGSTTITDDYTFWVTPPTAGTNVTITNAWAAGFNGNVKSFGKLAFDATVTGGGTTGNQTINKPAGTVNFAAAATTITVTNSFCTTSSVVIAVVRTADSTADIKNVVPGAGSFVINLSSAATAETSVGFIVLN